MIFLNKDDVSEENFVSLLEDTKVNIIKSISAKAPKEINGNIFEDLVFQQMISSSLNTSFEGHIEQTGAHSFPDIIARKLYGAEVKMTVGDKWISTGNSVLETTRIASVETIYMFFGKFGKAFDVKYRRYQECLNEVGVTHSPRYKIDMELAKGESIFDKMGIEYNDFRKEQNPIKRLKDYYRKLLKKGEELWWIDAGVEQRTVSPVIKTYNTLDVEEKNRFVIECMVFFPEIFGKSTSKFERPASYLVTHYNAVSPSLRDSFSAGGRVNVIVNGITVNVSRLLFNLYEGANDIRNILEFIPYETLSHYWKMKINIEPIELWKQLISKYSVEDADIVSVFEAGLNKG